MLEPHVLEKVFGVGERGIVNDQAVRKPYIVLLSWDRNSKQKVANPSCTLSFLAMQAP